MTTDELIDATYARIDALFPENDRGYGDDMRRILDLANRPHFSPVYMDSALSVLGELLGRMETDAIAQAEEDAYWSKMEAEAMNA
jgi:hypothetical protein